MSPGWIRTAFDKTHQRLLAVAEFVPPVPMTLLLACFIGVLGGYGAVLFSWFIDIVGSLSVEQILPRSRRHWIWLPVLCLIPAVGMLAVSWLTRRFAPEAEGHGVPEVITAVARKDGKIRPRVALVKILASGLCIGTGGSVGREGPIVQIGSTLGSMAGQVFGLSPRHIKVLVAAGAAAGISATFNAPLAGVIFASEIILGSFAVESLTPIVVASVLADVVQKHIGEHGHNPAFQHLEYAYEGAVSQLPTYAVLGLLCGVMAATFTKLLYAVEDAGKRWLPQWWLRALVLGSIVGVVAVFYPTVPTTSGSDAAESSPPSLFGVGYETVEYALHLKTKHFAEPESTDSTPNPHETRLAASELVARFWWLLPLAFLKPLMTSLTLGGGGSGGIFAPSLFIGATLGGAFGLACNILVPEASANPGVYAIVGMGAVVAGTTHGVMSAILIVYEMTDDYQIILPIMATAGLSSVVSRFIERESIYYKKLSRRGEVIARGHDMHHLEHIMVRDVMIRHFPTVSYSDNAADIVRVARANSHIESLPVMNDDDQLVGIIRPEDLHRVLDTEIASHLLKAEDIAIPPPSAVAADANLIEALREFGSRDVETLAVESGSGTNRRLVGLLLRADVMRRYRYELLQGDR